ncbi:MAG: ATP synthase F0 subunit C [Clostridiaceae bacterium]|jgi:F-type H+-transporting ATPase subunit c|nr:ATP synthase F0 subunit C [Clostridiaceae bacterium]
MLSYLLLSAIEGLGSISAAIVVGLTGFGAAMGMGMSVSKSVDAIGRQPEADGKIRTTLMIGLAFMETLAIYSLLVAILIMFV